MPLERVLEPEVMDTAEEASDYNAMDHTEVNRSFVNDLLNFAAAESIELTNVLDLGTGTALIPIMLCDSHPSCNVTAVDMAEHMLALARKNVADQNLEQRIELKKLDAKKLAFEDGAFKCVMTNSIIHHIPEPESCLEELVRATTQGGVIFVRDLMRPDTDEDVTALVQTYAGEEDEHARQMFDDSLRAALSLEEIQSLVAPFGFSRSTVSATSDRHWTWKCIKA